MPPPFRKRLKRRVRAALLRAVLGLLSFLPLRVALALGRGLGALAWRVAAGPRRLALEHLALAFPDWSDGERRAVARQTFVNLGEHLMEAVCIRQVDPKLDRWVELAPSGKAALDAALAEGRGVIVITGHIGHWELAARGLVHRGYPFVAAARESHDPGLQALIDGYRESGGVVAFPRARPDTARRILRQLRGGEGLFLLMDQDTRVQSVFAPFFGRLAKTPRAPADLALRTGAALVVGAIHRKGPGRGHVIDVWRVPVPEPSGDREADAVAVTARLNAELEGHLRRHPADWVWFHRRWRSRPPGALAAPADEGRAAV